MNKATTLIGLPTIRKMNSVVRREFGKAAYVDVSKKFVSIMTVLNPNVTTPFGRGLVSILGRSTTSFDEALIEARATVAFNKERDARRSAARK